MFALLLSSNALLLVGAFYFIRDVAEPMFWFLILLLVGPAILIMLVYKPPPSERP